MPDTIPATPWMDEQGLLCFKETLQTSRCYLEYGCGGSTVHACRTAQVPVVISVESDKAWIDKLAPQLTDSPSVVHLTHCDIGAVGAWGVPTSTERMSQFWRYMALPWQVARQHHHQPDTVLVDGRFRVASFLFSLLSARVGTTLLFDDYMERPEYFVVEDFCRLREVRGRMGVFTASTHYAMTDLVERIAEYSVVWD